MNPTVAHRLLSVGLICLLLLEESAAQTTTPTTTSTVEEPLELSPFVVSTSKDNGYATASTLSGTRLNTDMRDVGASVTDLTSTFLADIGVSDFQDALKYVPGMDNNIGGISGDPQNSAAILNGDNFRVRGFSSGTMTRDFLPTRAGGDNYNLDRFSFARGPNSLLFGLGDPGGAVNFVSKRAMFRSISNVAIRFDDWGSFRQEADFNRVLIPGRLAARVALMNDHQMQERKPSGKDSQRGYGAVTFRPFRKTTVRANFEKGHIDQIVVAPWTITDWFSEWVAAGSPLYDPSVSGPVPAVLQDISTAPLYPVLISQFGAGGRNMPAGFNYSDNYVSRTPATSLLGINNMRGVNSSAVYPLNSNPFGRGQAADQDFHNMTLFLDQQVGENLFVEATLFRGRASRFADYSMRPFGGQLRADASVKLRQTDGSYVANPNAGRLFWDEFNSQIRYNDTDDTVFRLTASYELDLSKRSRWFGKHQLAGLLERKDTVSKTESYALINLSRPLATAGFSNAQNRINVRTYVDASGGYSGSVLDMVPGSPFVDSTNYRNISPTGAFTPAWGLGTAATPGPGNQLNRLDSKQLMLQSRWFKNLIVTTLGWRHDGQRVWSANPLATVDAGSQLYRPIRDLNAKDADPNGYDKVQSGTATRGIVVNPLKWLALFYNESENFLPLAANAIDPYGRASFPNPSGVGKDFGLKLFLLNDRINVNLGFYESSARDNISGSIRSGTHGNIGQEFTEIWQFMRDADRGGPGETRFNSAPFLNNSWSDTIDRDASGFEASLVANPTPQWRVSVSMSKQKNLSANAGPRINAYFSEMSALLRRDYARYLNIPFDAGGGTTTTVSENLALVQGYLSALESLQGTEDSRQPTLAGNVVTNYTLSREGRFKGVGVGGAARYRGPAIIGYPTLASGAFDPRRPFEGPAVTEFDLWGSYQRRIMGNRFNWKFQVNINNVAGLDDLRALERIDKGAGVQTTRYFIPAGRRIQVTNTFEF